MRREIDIGQNYDRIIVVITEPAMTPDSSRESSNRSGGLRRSRIPDGFGDGEGNFDARRSNFDVRSSYPRSS